jgi:serine protease Do
MSILRFLPVILLVITGSLSAQTGLQEKILQAKDKVLPALVHIEPVKEIFTSGKRVKFQVTGSGMIFSPEGYILTNNHVAEKASLVKCTLANKEELQAEVIGLDALTDLAVLKLDLTDKGDMKLPFVEFGNSDSLQVGQFVLALGSPLGLSRSLSMGVISSLDRYFEDVGEMVSPFNLWIQTDAAINPGNSGGPLVDLNGRVVGINARAIFFGENLGFAIPVNTAKLVVDRILKYKQVERSWIGIEWQEIKEYRKYVNKPDLDGVMIADIEPDSPALKAGMQPGDIVHAVDGENLSAVYREELPKIRKMIAEIPVGKQIRIDYTRDGRESEANLTTAQRGKFEGNEFECEAWGLSVKEITPRIVKNLRLDNSNGVLVSGVRIGGPAHEADVYRGYVIKYVDDTPVKDMDQFRKLYDGLKDIPEKGIMLRLFYKNAISYALIRGEE